MRCQLQLSEVLHLNMLCSHRTTPVYCKEFLNHLSSSCSPSQTTALVPSTKLLQPGPDIKVWQRTSEASKQVRRSISVVRMVLKTTYLQIIFFSFLTWLMLWVTHSNLPIFDAQLWIMELSPNVWQEIHGQIATTARVVSFPGLPSLRIYSLSQGKKCRRNSY